MQKSFWVILSVLVFILAVVLLLPNFFSSYLNNDHPEPEAVEMTEVHPKILSYGFDLDSFTVDSGVIKRNQFLSDILTDAGISSQKVFELAQAAEKVQFGPDKSKIASTRNMREGNNYALVYQDTSSAPRFFVYEPDSRKYVIYDLGFENDIKVVERPRELQLVYDEGSIESSLWVAMASSGVAYSLITKMEEALGWVISFDYVQHGDVYKLVYEKEYIDGQPSGVGKLLGAYFATGGQEYYAYYYENEKYHGYFDGQGRPMVRQFLMSPISAKYRISSRYNPSRFHPVLKIRRAHLGTDFAANYGTPIQATADGTVIMASYTKGNGNFVKIRHDKTFETQYLHMKGFASGIRPGVRVRQGQTIGYVGSTGLATGPHVCYRFWKNGKQIDPLKLNFPPPEPMAKEDLPAFNVVKDQIRTMIDTKIVAPINQSQPVMATKLDSSADSTAKTEALNLD